jgi:RNA polymerase sigma factor (TIGR02999 family)
MSRFIELIDAANAGEPGAVDDLFDLVYHELRRLATRQMGGEPAGHTLQPTALVHEAYLRLVRPATSGLAPAPTLPWSGRGPFYASAARAMRRILIESARRRRAERRGGGRARERLDPEHLASPALAEEVLALHDALTELAAIEPGVAELVELRFFGGLTLKESAEILGIAPRTADAHWAYARAWLQAEMAGGA